MPVSLTTPSRREESNHPPEKKWTRDEYTFLERAGLDLNRYELIEGKLIQKVGKNLPHMLALSVVVEWLINTFPGFVMPEPSANVAPADNPTNEPEPDCVVLAIPRKQLTHKPCPHEIALIVEVSDTTLQFDLTVKAGLYARAAIVEYWVIDLNNRRIIVHRDPADGQYRSIIAYAEDEFVACLAAPDSEVKVADLL